MSLLLEALKKAEQAKQHGTALEQAHPPAPASAAASAPAEEIPGLEFTLEAEAATAPAPEPQEPTRETLADALDFPEIALAEPETSPDAAEEPIQAAASAPAGPHDTFGQDASAATERPAGIESRTMEETPPAPAPAADQKLAAQRTEPAPAKAPGGAAAPTKEQPQAAPEADRAAAQNVFASKQAKGKRPNRSLLLGALAIIAVLAGGGGYYYWQLLSIPTIALPVRPPQPVRAAPPAPVPEAAPVAAAEPSSPPPQDETPTKPRPRRDDTAVAAKETARQGEETPTTEQAGMPPAKGGEAPALKIIRGTAPDQVNPVLLGAYQAYMAGDAARAEKAYRQVLRQNPRNRDALLGLAAIATGRQQAGEAVDYYLQMLELDPKDAAAQAGLINLQGQADPVQSESRLKTLLAQTPEAGFLHFALGNLYAQQSRWGEAQREYFEAFGADPTNADYAFNLAVGLDHLNQAKPAAKYYQQALGLAATHPAAFDRGQAQERLRALSQLPPR